MAKKVTVFGAGKIGQLVAHFLSHSKDYFVTVVDSSAAMAQKAVHSVHGSLPNAQFKVADFHSATDLEAILQDQDYALSSAPFYCNKSIAEAAKKCGAHYLDLTEDVKTTDTISLLSQNASTAFIPQCGLAPGFITIASHHLVGQFDEVHDVKMRVGALPLFPHNRLKYNLTWSTAGLINEYCNPCKVIENSQLQWVQPLEGEERFHLDGVEYEAFHTSGGLGSYADSLVKKVRSMNYKSIRYVGHREQLLLLLHDLKFIDDRQGLAQVFERSLPYTDQDVVLVFVTVTGLKQGRLMQKSYAKKIYHGEIDGIHWGAIQITTAAGICAVLDLHANNRLPKAGFIKQENIDYNDFIQNRFGKYYK